MSTINQGNGVGTVTIAGMTIASSALLVLTAHATGGQYDTLRNNGTAYQVTTGKTLYIFAIDGTSQASATLVYCQFGYGDTSVSDSAAAPTNSVLRRAGGIAQWAQELVFAPSTPNNIKLCNITVPASKYPYFLPQGGAAAMTVYAYEV